MAKKTKKSAWVSLRWDPDSKKWVEFTPPKAKAVPKQVKSKGKRASTEERMTNLRARESKSRAGVYTPIPKPPGFDPGVAVRDPNPPSLKDMADVSFDDALPLDPRARQAVEMTSEIPPSKAGYTLSRTKLGGFNKPEFNAQLGQFEVDSRQRIPTGDIGFGEGGPPIPSTLDNPHLTAFTGDFTEATRATGKPFPKHLIGQEKRVERGARQLYRAIKDVIPSERLGGVTKTQLQAAIADRIRPEILYEFGALKGAALREGTYNLMNLYKQDEVLGGLFSSYMRGPHFSRDLPTLDEPKSFIDTEDMTSGEIKKRFTEGRSLKDMSITEPRRMMPDARLEEARTAIPREQRATALSKVLKGPESKKQKALADAYEWVGFGDRQGKSEGVLPKQLRKLNSELQAQGLPPAAEWADPRTMKMGVPGEVVSLLDDMGLPKHPGDAANKIYAKMRQQNSVISKAAGPIDVIPPVGDLAMRLAEGPGEEALVKKGWEHPVRKFTPGVAASEPHMATLNPEAGLIESVQKRTSGQGSLLSGNMQDVAIPQSRFPEPGAEMDLMDELGLKLESKGTAKKGKIDWSKLSKKIGKKASTFGKAGATMLPLMLLMSMFMGGDEDG